MLDGNPADFSKIKDFKERFEKIKEKRLASSAERIRKKADYPYLFCQIRQPNKSYLLFPRHSSGERRYIPIGFMSSEIIVGDACYMKEIYGLLARFVSSPFIIKLLIFYWLIKSGINQNL